MIKLSNKKLFIFDFDGTIADTSLIHEAAFQKALAKFSNQLNFTYEEFKGMSTREALTSIFKQNQLKISQSELTRLVGIKQRYSAEMLEKNALLLPGFSKFYGLLKEKNKCIASLASKRSIEIVLSKFSLNDFEYIISSHEVKASKPSPECFLKALSMYEFDASEAVIFEASKNGIEAARRASIDCIDINVHDWHHLFSQFNLNESSQ